MHASRSRSTPPVPPARAESSSTSLIIASRSGFVTHDRVLSNKISVGYVPPGHRIFDFLEPVEYTISVDRRLPQGVQLFLRPGLPA